ncbi:uncharacterized protein STEHIDRAFT_62751 [Stereum hirsutum FP-91666 SS1]|uniref:uncharacterized protein n=1 Tax=Stereum hirsutum (strain FP-91666) TaxID=721885 RepID=UPI00044492B6|nr:uncharacterized protein STEHIDRAFT_62751 [Stereum hirsutum FP-91666 SS1]EIM83335.1 hypothetical protein STEHIDRAFT_62751 [Stereum hirsutum FP-91666 SS1]
MSDSGYTSHTTISPAILYWGTPVAIVSTTNPDNSPNLAPISSIFWLGHRCIIGLQSTSQTTQNILRTSQCVINLPDDTMSSSINALARTMGTPDVPTDKVGRGYRYVKDKFGVAGLMEAKSDLVEPPRVKECPVQMEGEVVKRFGLMEDMDTEAARTFITLFEVKILTVHVWKGLVSKEHANRIDANKWRPMIMSFSRLYGLKDGELEHSVLAEIDEEKYRVGDL